MSKRTYNILFHTHTVSGIVISAALYVIFFAGSFSFFRDEIVSWEREEVVDEYHGMAFDFDHALDSLDTQYDLYGRDVTFNKIYNERRINVTLGASKDTLSASKNGAGSFFYLDTKTLAQHSYVGSYTLGEFLYRLHFFAQIYYPVGYYLSGFVALFFLFTIITGVIIHWKKIVSNFYLFRPKAKLKALWTDAHTALGILGLPFQFVYAVTGAFFMLKILVVAPSVIGLYDGDQAKMYQDLEYAEPSYTFTHQNLDELPSVNNLVAQAKNQWQDFNITKIIFSNYGDVGMHVTLFGEQDYNMRFAGPGKIIHHIAKGTSKIVKDPEQGTSYLDGVKNALFRLHYGDYGGYFLKVISFVLGIVTCVVILSGVLIWLVARDRKNVSTKQKRFNNRVAQVYLAICLSMYPITALSFSVVKIAEAPSQSFIDTFYFVGWLLLSLLFMIKKDLNFINKYTLLLGSMLGLLVPLVNGMVSGNWFWVSLQAGNLDYFVVDIFWLILASITLWVYLRLRVKAARAEK